MTPRAMVLAAGMGTRLQPLTDKTPKALLQYNGKTMLEWVIIQLKQADITEVIINLHHLGDQIRDFVDLHDGFGLDIQFSDESDELLDTGGGIVKATPFLSESDVIIVHNIDIYTSLNINKLLAYHENQDAIATLAVTERKSSRNLLIDESGLLCGWRNKQTGEEIIVHERTDLRPFAFSGIHLLNPSIFELLPNSGAFSITKAYLDLAKHYRIMTFDHTGDEWVDMANPSLHFS